MVTRNRLLFTLALSFAFAVNDASAQNYCPGATLVTVSPSVGEELLVPPLNANEWDQNAHNLSAICRGETFPNDTALPATCSVGQVFFDTATPAIYGCTSTNTWEELGGGGGGDGSSTADLVNLQKSSDQSILASTITSIIWQTEIEDVGGYHAANAAAVVVPTGRAGVFSITCGAWFASGTGARFVEIQVGGTSIARQREANIAVAEVSVLNVTRTRRLADAASVTCAAYQESGGALNVVASAMTFFTVARLGD